MQINDSNVHINFEAYAQKPREVETSQDRGPTSNAGEGGPVDKVVLSPKAREIHEARQRLADVPDVDDARVSELRLKVETGVYEINGRRIAERMLQEMSLHHTMT